MCVAAIPVSCRAGRQDDYCMSMSDDYRDRYLLPEPACHMVCSIFFAHFLIYRLSNFF